MPFDSANKFGAEAQLCRSVDHDKCAEAPMRLEAFEAKQVASDGQALVVSNASTRSLGTEATFVVLESHARTAAALGDLCGDIIGLQRQRVFAIRMQSRCDRAVEAYVRTRLGYSSDMSEAERKKLSLLALKIVKSVAAGVDAAGLGQQVAAVCAPVILRTKNSRICWDDLRRDTEKGMIALAKQLPAQAFVAETKGFSHLGLAVLVGEAGNLGDYPKKGHLWKRLGLSVEDGHRQGVVPPGLPKEERAAAWIKRGYSPARRAEVYAFIDDVLFRSQWRGATKDDAGNLIQAARPIGPYGEHYGRKRAEYVDRFSEEKGGKAHADKAARRYMAKMFIRDLWKAWRADLAGQEAVQC
jgi:hypothetical protein